MTIRQFSNLKQEEDFFIKKLLGIKYVVDTRKHNILFFSVFSCTLYHKFFCVMREKKNETYKILYLMMLGFVEM